MYLQGSRELPFELGSMSLKPQHIAGRNNVISDALSRVTPLEFQDSNADKDILAVKLSTVFFNRRKGERWGATRNSQRQRTPITKTVHFYRLPIEEKPDSYDSTPLLEFSDMKLTIGTGILMKNSKVLIPETLKQKYLRQIHQGHQGIEACRSGAREFVFWVKTQWWPQRISWEMWLVLISTEILLLSFRNMFLKYHHIHGTWLVQIYSISGELTF